MDSTCIFNNCMGKQHARGYCRAHTNHLYRYGEARLLSTEPNEIINREGYVDVVMYKRDLRPSGVFIKVDDADYEKIKGKRFYISHGYAKESKSKTQYLHRIICPCEFPLVCDHINEIKTDCRRKNLRCVTRKENIKNMTTPLYEYSRRKRKKSPILFE